MRLAIRTWMVLALVSAAMVLPIGAAHASCAEAIPLDRALTQAHVVFVGTVTGLDYQDRVATFDVEDVWKGTVGATALVTGTSPIAELEAARAQGSEMATSVDRSYQSGERYLVVAHGEQDGALLDNECSNTQIYTADLDALRPAGAQLVVPPASGGVDPVVWIGLAAAAVVAAAGIGWKLARRRIKHRPAGTAAA